MNIVMYLVPSLFSVTMLINGAMRYWGFFDKESMEAIFYYYIPSKREESNWKVSQNIYGKNLLIAGLLNIITEVVLIPIANKFSFFYMFIPSLFYMFGARFMMERKLKHLEDAERRNE